MLLLALHCDGQAVGRPVARKVSRQKPDILENGGYNMTIKACKYTIKSSTTVCKEILDTLADPFCKINFCNFSKDDFYYDNNGAAHEIEIDKSKKQIIIF